MLYQSNNNKVFLKEVSYAHQGCICFISKNSNIVKYKSSVSHELVSKSIGAQFIELLMVLIIIIYTEKLIPFIFQDSLMSRKFKRTEFILNRNLLLH